MRKDIDKKVEMTEEMAQAPMETSAKSTPKPIKIGVHVEYEDKEFVVQNIMGEEIFIAMGDESHTVKKSDVKTIK